MASSLPIPPQASSLPSQDNNRNNGHSNVDVTNNGGRVHVGDNNESNQGYIGNGSHNFVNLGSIDLKMGAEGELESILGPYVSRDALHDSWNAPPECHEGTRRTTLTAIEDWIENSGSKASPILWLYGPAGVGKSVIAKTVAGLANKVVATFFFSTSSDRTAATLFPTLAWQLASNIPDTKQHIIDALKNRCLPQTSQIERQFNLLITEPLRKSKTAMESSSGIIMIIDGVDECTDEDMRTRFLKVLERSGNNGDTQLRFLICSRPEPGICDVLDKTYEDHVTTVQPPDASGGPPVPTLDSYHDPNTSQQRRALCLRLREYVEPYLPDIKSHLNSLKEWRPHHAAELFQEVCKLYRALPHGEVRVHLLPEPSGELDKISPHRVVSRLQIGLSPESEQDIKKYLNDRFVAINQQRQDLGEWFELCTVQKLAAISCGQFLYASTIIRLLDGRDFYPKDVLDMALSSSSPSPDMDKLYKEILKKQAQSDALKDILIVLAVFSENVHFANIRNTFPIIESLLNLQKGRLTTKLNKMHSLIRIVPGKSVNVYHRSFLEFLQNENRSGIYYIPYQAALRRFLVLLRKALFRYTFAGLWRQLSNDDHESFESLRDMIIAFPRNFFKLSNNPTTLASFHALAHSLPVILVWAVLCWFTSPFWGPIICSLPLSAVEKYVLRYVLIMLSFGALSYSSLLFSLMYYESQLRRCIIRPFFHPFLHPHLVKSVELLFGLRPLHVFSLLLALVLLVISNHYSLLFPR